MSETLKLYRVLPQDAKSGKLITQKAGVDKDGNQQWSRPKAGDVIALTPEAAEHLTAEGYVDPDPVEGVEPSPPRLMRAARRNG